MQTVKLKSICIILVGLVLLAAVASAEAGLSDEQIYSLYRQGTAAFRQANSTAVETGQKRLYEKSALFFEKIVNEGGIENSKLYYNIANAYFLNGDIGKAILNYRRAEILDRTDADIQKNLAFARSKRLDKVKIKTEQRILKTLFFWHYDFSIRTRFLICCICFAAVCISLTLMLWFGRNTPAKAVVSICGLLIICFFISTVIEAAGRSGRVCGVITAGQVIARQGDSQNYAASFKEPLHAGTEFDLLENRQGWIHIELSDGSDTWIPQQSAELI